MIRNRLYAALILAFAPAAALAFDAADSVVFPSSGRFPAYPPEALGGVVAPPPVRATDAPGGPPSVTGRPTTVWAQVGIMRDSNILRQPDGAERSDTVMRYGVGARHEARISRQTIVLGADAAYYDFDRFNALDHLGYGLLAEARWELGSALTGTAGYTRRQMHADMAEVRAAREDLIITDRGYATAALRVTPDFRIRGGVESVDVDREGDARVGVSTEATGFTLGADYVTPLGNAIGIETRRTDGEIAPASGLVTPLPNNDYEETEVALVATYNPGTATRLSARLGRTERKFDAFPGRNFDGNTGRFSLEYGLTPRTILEAEAWREARSIVDVGASYVDSRGWSIGGRWAATAKIAAIARYMQERRKYDANDPLLTLLVPTGPFPTSEKIRLFRLGAGYELTRHIQLMAGWDRGSRSSDVGLRDYDYNALSLNARWVF